MKRKILISTLSLVAAFACAFALSACDKSDKKTANVGYVLNDDGNSYCCASIENSATAQSIVIDSQVDGKPVTSIGGGAFIDCRSVKSVTIPDTVTSIGSFAFGNCTALTNISLSDNVTSVGRGAFIGCSSLASATIGGGLAKISEDMFNGCAALKSVTIPQTVTEIADNAFLGCYNLIEVYNLSELEISAGATDNGYVGYYALGVYDDAGVQSKIDKNSDGYVFYADGGNVVLATYEGSGSELQLPADYNGNNYKIRDYAFYKNTNITSVIIPQGVTEIGDGAFGNCSSLASVTIGGGVTSIGANAFHNCIALASATFENASGWQISVNKDMSEQTAAPALSEAAQNAQYLRNVYAGYYWRRG